ncbi:chemotaxis protein CheA [Phaeobacter sp. 22II1-1F12B]|uniref:chemotaxis protein CheA n=1 Tax=Phaeobacter sp. 22II1-1F12B TaxID=1317111 RepID=UPI000B527BB5|nr:chemotaxis protein CheA [Phaeobacter sp. 22II1-1F12B]
MVNNNKILTVSYGTFSCTLEGFDDSFDMMKEIAEYFRTLAADDRYFGAEPPKLDAEMLTQIAQRDRSRQIEARADESGTGVVLRASSNQNASTPATPAAPVAKAEEATVPEAAEDVVQPTHQSPVSAQQGGFAAFPESTSVASAGTGPDSIAAKLKRIRAVVSRNEAEQQADKADTEAATDTVETASGEDAIYEEVATASDAPDTELAAIFDRIDAKSETDEPVTSDGDAERRLTEYDEDYEEDSAADDGRILAALAEQKAREPRVEAQAETEEDPEPEIVAEVEEDENEEPDLDLSSYFAEPEPEEEVAIAEEPETDDAEPETVEIAEETATDETPLAPADDEENAAISRENARLVQLKRAEIEAALAGRDAAAETMSQDDDSDDEPDMDLSTRAAARTDAAESDLSAEDEADLMRELAALQDDLIGETEEPEAPEEPSATDETDHVEAEEIETATQGLDNDVSRLMAAAEEKMDAPEYSTSRNTYSRLRAAVAAAQAERSAGHDLNDDKGDDAYRQDLASVVRPRRPDNNRPQRPERPASENRAAPLKLVAEQRIDIEQSEKSRLPVRPRRIKTELLDTPADGQSEAFASYAKQMGAKDLPQLLEAAAAYLSFVEGREEFSRPQLMNKVRQLPSIEFNREDGLRSFGLLLREGKICKNGGGRFTASVDIGFRPAKRAAG